MAHLYAFFKTSGRGKTMCPACRASSTLLNEKGKDAAQAVRGCARMCAPLPYEKRPSLSLPPLFDPAWFDVASSGACTSQSSLCRQVFPLLPSSWETALSLHPAPAVSALPFCPFLFPFLRLNTKRLPGGGAFLIKPWHRPTFPRKDAQYHGR